ncbi:O-antigen ligase family protein [Mucilaginibacter sp. RS28]|uniref:O-antigen ligase family protein n=1 Tax=Mucilaginibacter straminoryzae TaxID=2932774 RepID=A0A9X1X4R9_9SPHI|nr:O-antigen ligase family protein [Mucilaginibacter straminoryzae]MCJ8211014.1 O-antigen ligase family protein [Mucilaginibacter straminoryzae]
MSHALQVILPGLTVLLFILHVFYKGNTVESCLLFILAMLPLMDLKITIEAWGGFKTFDFLCFYCLIFLLKDFTTINLRVNHNFYLFLFILLSIIIILGGLTSEFPGHTYLSFLKTLPIFIFGRFLMTECAKDPSFLYRAIRALKAGYVAALIFLALQVAMGLSFTFYPGLSPNTIDPVFHIVRWPGVFYDSQAHGQFLAMGSFLFLFVEEGSPRKTYILNYLAFALAIVGINLAGSRAAFGGFLVGLVIVFLMTARQYRIYGIIAVVIAYLVVTFVNFHSGVFDRAKNFSQDLSFRQSIWKEAYDISKKHPYLGIGSGNYQNYVMRHSQDQYLEVEDGQLVFFDQPENGYLKIMVELGFIGFAIFALYIIVPLVKGFINYLKGNVDNRVAFLMASLVSWLVAFNTVYSIYDYRLLIMVACMVVLIVTYPAKEYYSYRIAHEQEV